MSKRKTTNDLPVTIVSLDPLPLDIQAIILQLYVRSKKQRATKTLVDLTRTSLQKTASSNTTVSRLATYPEWQYQVDDTTWKSYPCYSNTRIEACYQYGITNFHLSSNKDLYTIDFTSNYQQNVASKTIRPIRRVERQSCVELDGFQPLKTTDCSFRRVADLFYSTTKATYGIKNIYQVKNDHLFPVFVGMKSNFAKRLGTDKCQEKWLWHGSSYESLRKIQIQGFNRDYNEKHIYGKGVYFARDASYSAHDVYSVPNPTTNFKYMLFSRVILGDCHLGKEDMKNPISKTNDTLDTYDTRVDNLQNPSIFVTTRDGQQIPEFLVEFVTLK